MRPFMLLALLVACGSPAPVEPAPSAKAPIAQAPVADQSQARARAALDRVKRELKERLTTAMATGGPEAAARACSDEAQTLTAQVAKETGVKVGRSSLRLRNPANAGPAWVADWLTSQGERPAEGVAPFAAAAEVDGKPVTRLIDPIRVEAPCVACHGPKETLAPAVRDVLSAKYPADEATGYGAGDLRGAFWAEG